VRPSFIGYAVPPYWREALDPRRSSAVMSGRRKSPAVKARNSGNCAPPSAAPVSGAIKGSGSRRDMLAKVYGWFTEGFDTRDIKESKALLEALDA
jgi:hypothetical protein